MNTFDRLKDEPPKPYAAFRIYCELGANRSVVEVSRKCSKHPSLLNRWSAKYMWVDRARAYDEHHAVIQREAEKQCLESKSMTWASRQAALREDEWRTADQLLERARLMLEWPLDKQVQVGENGVTIIRPAKWSITDAVRIVEVASKLRRMAVGEATEHVKVSSLQLDYSKLSTDDLRAFRDLLRKCSKAPDDVPRSSGGPVRPALGGSGGVSRPDAST